MHMCRDEERIRGIFSSSAAAAQPQGAGSNSTLLPDKPAAAIVPKTQAQLQQALSSCSLEGAVAIEPAAAAATDAGDDASPVEGAWCVGNKAELRVRFPMPAQDVLDGWLPGLKRTMATTPR